MSTVHLSNILTVLKNTPLKSCERLYIKAFLSFSKSNLNACLSVPNCKLFENILDTFCIAQIWYDISILMMFTVVKCRGHTNFDLSKIYEGIISTKLQFGTLKVLYLDV